MEAVDKTPVEFWIEKVAMLQLDIKCQHVSKRPICITAKKLMCSEEFGKKKPGSIFFFFFTKIIAGYREIY